MCLLKACTCILHKWRQQNMRPVSVWFTGSWEERRQGSFLTFWSNTHHLQEPVSTLVSLPRLMKQNFIKTASSATLHAAAWIENVTRPWIYWWHLTTQHITTNLIACAPVQADGCRLSIFQAAREPSLRALSFTQDLHSTLQRALSLLLRTFYLSRPGVSKIRI